MIFEDTHFFFFHLLSSLLSVPSLPFSVISFTESFFPNVQGSLDLPPLRVRHYKAILKGVVGRERECKSAGLLTGKSHCRGIRLQ